MSRRALLEITEEFVREGLTPSLWAQIMEECFIYKAWHSPERRCYYYECCSKYFIEVLDGKPLPVWVPELVKVPWPGAITRYTIQWRMKRDPNVKPGEAEQSPSYKDVPYRDGTRVTI